MKPTLDLIIIGAGASGLSAASFLLKKNLRFKILEAKAHLGGRANSSGKHPPVEWGAEFIHGEAKLTRELFQKLKIGSFDPQYEYQLFSKNRLQKNSQFWEKLGKTLKQIKKVTPDQSFEESLRQLKAPLQNKKMARTFIEGFDAADSNLMSSNAVVESRTQVTDPDERKAEKTLQGYSEFFTRLAKPFQKNIFFHHRVATLEWKPGSVLVKGKMNGSGRSFSYSAKKVLVTVPLGVLKAKVKSTGAIEFSPSLNEFRSVYQLYEMGQVTKLILQLKPEFEARVRKEKDLSFISAPEFQFTAWWSSGSVHWPYWVAWAGGTHSEQLQKKSKSERGRIAAQEFAKIAGCSLSTVQKNLIKIDEHDWKNDPYACGAYSYPGVGYETGDLNHFQCIQNTLYFAGELFEPEHQGTVEGALRSGKKIAKKIARKMP